MSFERKHVQETCELELGYSSYTEIESDKKNLTNRQFDQNFLEKIRIAAVKDLSNFYFKAIVSLFEALRSVSDKRYSWSTIKLYYSVYYLLQVEMLARGTVLIRAGGLYRLTLQTGQTFYNNKTREYNSDHSGTILHFMHLFRNSDPLLSNNINGKDSYLWLKDQRERVNYRERHFSEPGYQDFWSGPVSFGLDSKTIGSTIQKYTDDNSMVYTFQENHAILSIPIQRLLQTKKVLEKYGHKNILSEDERDFLKTILPCKNLEEYINF